MRKYRDYTDNDIIEKARQVNSVAGLLRALGLKAVGGNYANIQRQIQKLKINTSHWTGPGWSKNQQLKDWSEYTKAASLKPHLIKLRSHVCEHCKLSEWLGQAIKLEVHHKNGNRTDNSLENLELLCPNCHSFTKNFRRPNHIDYPTNP